MVIRSRSLSTVQAALAAAVASVPAQAPVLEAVPAAVWVRVKAAEPGAAFFTRVPVASATRHAFTCQTRNIPKKLAKRNIQASLRSKAPLRWMDALPTFKSCEGRVSAWKKKPLKPQRNGDVNQLLDLTGSPLPRAFPLKSLSVYYNSFYEEVRRHVWRGCCVLPRIVIAAGAPIRFLNMRDSVDSGR